MLHVHSQGEMIRDSGVNWCKRPPANHFKEMGHLSLARKRSNAISR